jgi:hypothetical protein
MHLNFLLVGIPIGWGTDEIIRQSVALFWFGLRDVRVSSYILLTSSNDQMLTFPHFWRLVWWKRLRFVTIQPKIPTRGLDAFLYEAAQNFEVFSKIQDQTQKIQNL